MRDFQTPVVEIAFGPDADSGYIPDFVLTSIVFSALKREERE